MNPGFRVLEGDKPDPEISGDFNEDFLLKLSSAHVPKQTTLKHPSFSVDYGLLLCEVWREGSYLGIFFVGCFL